MSTNTLIRDTLKTEILSTKVTAYSGLNEETQRHLAVATALELIKADVSASYSTGGTSYKSSTALREHMENLEGYTNLIMRAMEGNQ